MAIIRQTTTEQSQEENLNLVINNGDLKVLKATVEKLGFKDEESVLRYMLAVLSKTAVRSMTVIDQDGAKVSLSPSDSLLKENNK